MNLSDTGLARIKGYEGYKKALPNGDCMAYQDKYIDKKTGKVHLDIPTIGWGCTEGVEMGMVWTREQAEQALRREIAKHEAAISRMVTVEINQNQYDALCALSYNIGSEALRQSTVMRRLNKGDYAGAAAGFHLFNKSGGIVIDGLISRRASEAGLFMRGMPDDDHQMPQTVEASRPPITATQATIAAAPVAAGAVPVVQAVTEAVKSPAIPAPPTAILESATAWKGFSGQVLEFGAFAISSPKSIVVIGVAIAAMVFGPKIAPKLFGRE